MASFTLVDTDILIDAGRNIEFAIEYLDRLEQQGAVAIAVVTQLELIVGCQNKGQLRALETFLQRFRVVPLTPAISQQAVALLREYRLSHGLLIADGLIAATAIVSGVPLASKNQRDYRFVGDLHLLPYQ